MTKLSEMLKVQEGYRNRTYLDSRGNPTWGVGHYDPHSPVGTYHSDAQIALQLDTDISAATGSLERNCPWVASLDPVRRDVLINMAFNMGFGRLSGFHDMLAAAKAGDWNTAATEMLDSLWASQVGNRAEVLAKMMRTGVYPAGD